VEEAEVFDTILAAHKRLTQAMRYEIMQTLDRLGFHCETWAEARETALWLLGGVHDRVGILDWRPSDDRR